MAYAANGKKGGKAEGGKRKRRARGGIGTILDQLHVILLGEKTLLHLEASLFAMAGKGKIERSIEEILSSFEEVADDPTLPQLENHSPKEDTNEDQKLEAKTGSDDGLVVKKMRVRAPRIRFGPKPQRQYQKSIEEAKNKAEQRKIQQVNKTPFPLKVLYIYLLFTPSRQRTRAGQGIGRRRRGLHTFKKFPV